MNRLISRLALIIALAGSSAENARAQILTQAIEVRSLSVAAAEEGRPAKLRGVVVFVEGTSAVFVQDATSTTFFRTRQLPLPSVGDEIEVSGKTRMGLYLPGLDYSTFQILGRSKLPPGIVARYDDLAFSRFHYQRVTLEGIVRSVSTVDPNKGLIRLAMGTRVIEARVETPLPPGRSLVDHRVRITGLAAGLINKRRQLVQPYVRVVDWNEVEVIAPAPPVTDVPLISAEELLAFRVSGHGEQRVRIEGEVTAVFPRDQLYLRQGKSAFAARLENITTIVPGDHVAIVGFPEMDRTSASVVDAELVSRTPGPFPTPLVLASPDAIDEMHDCQLIQVAGIVRDTFKADDGAALLIAGRVRTLQVRLPPDIESPAVGAKVQITGISHMELAVSPSGFAGSPGIISLRARSGSDLVVLQMPPWWTARRLAGLLAVLAGITALAGLWIAVLRRQVGRQTEALRRRIESEAALEERQRIAREFHDTLEQELAGVSLRLDALATRALDDKGRNLIDASRNLVSRIQTETRDLISDLRDPTETAGDLAAALSAVASRQSSDHGVEVRLESPGSLPELAATTVHDLRMIARESITNAIKHGRATSVAILVKADEAHLIMKVVDNGCGFDATTATEGRRGHFGCSGIRERGRKIGAEITWSSVLQKGATVEVTLPLHSRDLPRVNEPQVVNGVPSPRIDASAR